MPLQLSLFIIAVLPSLRSLHIIRGNFNLPKMQLSRLFNFLLLVGPLVVCRAVTSSDEVHSYDRKCKNPIVRREW